MASGNMSHNTRNSDYMHALGSTAAFSSSTAAVNGVLDTPQESFTTTDDHSIQGRPAASLMPEFPEPSVGAEVDCPGDGYMEASHLLSQNECHLKMAALETVSAVPPAGQRGGRRRPHRPEDRNCCCCDVKFERQGRSFNRRAVYTFTTAATVKWAFPESVVHDKSFLCETCAQLIRTKCKRKQTGKRCLWVKPPAAKQPEGTEKKKKERRMGKKSKAAQLVSKSCYKAALKTLWSAKGARKPMMDFWCRQLKEEMKLLSRQQGSPFHQKVSSRKALSSFPWRRCLSWAQDKAPLVTTCLRSLFPDISTLTKIGHSLSEEQAQTLLERRSVVALSIPLFTRNIWKNNFLQAALGAELRLQGCSGSAIDTLNTMGLCQNKDTIRLLLQRLLFGKRTNEGQRIKLKGEPISDVEEEDIGEEVEVELEEEDEEEVDEEAEIELELEGAAEVDEEDVQIGEEIIEDEDEEDQAVLQKEEEEKKKKRRKEKKLRKDRGQQNAEEEEEDDDEGAEQKKRRVVVVRFGDDTQTLDDLTFQLPKAL